MSNFALGVSVPTPTLPDAGKVFVWAWLAVIKIGTRRPNRWIRKAFIWWSD
jgi:hypothetical protein